MATVIPATRVATASRHEAATAARGSPAAAEIGNRSGLRAIAPTTRIDEPVNTPTPAAATTLPCTARRFRRAWDALRHGCPISAQTAVSGRKSALRPATPG